jgi:phenylacetate-CoA ligase
VLVGYGGWLSLFFRAVEARGLPLPPPKLVLSMGEALPHGAREHIEGRFGIPVLSRYNAVEAFKIGFFCERRTGFHLHEDLCHLRVVDAEGRDVPCGEPGRIVISNLVNRASVLLNYPIGDFGALSSLPCPCGRTLRLLSELEGRVEDILALADGRFVHPRAVWQVLKDEGELLQYQLRQVAARRFVLTLVTVDEPVFARLAGRVVPELERLLGPQAEIEVRRGSAPDLRAGGGKYRAVVSLGGASP